MLQRDKLLAQGREQIITYLGYNPGVTFKEIREANAEILSRHLDEILAKLQTDGIISALRVQWGAGIRYSLRVKS